MTFAIVILLSIKAGRSKLPNFEILRYQDPKRIASWWRWWLRFPEANIWTPSLICEILTTAVNDSASIDTRPEILETSNFEYLLAMRGCWQLMPLTRTNLLENWEQNGRKWDFESIWCWGRRGGWGGLSWCRQWNVQRFPWLGRWQVRRWICQFLLPRHLSRLLEWIRAEK